MDTPRYSVENLVLSNLLKDTQDLCQDHTTIRPFPFCTACLIHPQPGAGHCSHTGLFAEDAITSVAEAAPARHCQQHRF